MTEAIWQEERLLIDGKLVPAQDRRKFPNINPATEEILGMTSDASHADMASAIDAARRAFDSTSWSTDLQLRLQSLRQLESALQDHADQLRNTMVAEVGCTIIGTHTQVDAPISGIHWPLQFAEQYDWEHDLGAAVTFGIHSRRYVRREPIGVVGAITPWNFPLQINLAKLIPALVSGCTVVLKAAPDTPWTATLLGQLVTQYTDLPPGVLNIVTSADHAIGQQLVEDPRVDMISFTGSTVTGSHIMVKGAPTLKKLFLELGGKSANIVLEDANIEAAAQMSVSHVTSHAGQGCAILSRLVLPRSHYKAGVEAVVEALKNVAYGDPTDPANAFGPLIRAQQRERVLDYIQQGVSDGAALALGGGRPRHLPRGYYVEPTVLINVEPDAVVAQEEIFGPVLVVLSHDGDDDAVAIANDSRYGLSGAVFSGDIERARNVANQVRTGTMSLNGGIWYGSDVPFGGYKHSGTGRENGQAGFEEYLETKSIAEPV